jgi:hypothetical protein
MECSNISLSLHGLTDGPRTARHSLTQQRAAHPSPDAQGTWRAWLLKIPVMVAHLMRRSRADGSAGISGGGEVRSFLHAGHGQDVFGLAAKRPRVAARFHGFHRCVQVFAVAQTGVAICALVRATAIFASQLGEQVERALVAVRGDFGQ